MLARVIRRAFCQSPQTTFANQFTIENDLENLKKQLTWRNQNNTNFLHKRDANYLELFKIPAKLNKKLLQQTKFKNNIKRASNMGMRELDLLLGTFAKEKLKTFTKDELIQFNKDVLIQETPTLNKMLLGQIPIPEGNRFIPIVIEFAKNKPKYVYF